MSDDTPEYDSPRSESLWLATTPATDYDPFEGGLDVDVAIVGGGITGLSAAINLRESGRRVAVLESDRIVESTTGHTTAKLTSQHGLLYETLISRFGREKARQYANANEAAIAEVERRVDDAAIDCDFRRTDAYTYAASAADLERVRDEVDAAQRVGLPASYVEETPLPFDVPGAVRFEEQAAFHPRQYLLAIAETIHGDGSYVFEETRALDIDPGSPCRVETERGDVIADDVVVATQFPFFDRAGYFARMHPHRAYLLAVRIHGTPPAGMYYNTASPPATMRRYPATEGSADDENETLLIVGGQSHKPGLEGVPTSERYRRCEAFAREHFDVASIEYRWSTMDYSPVDRVPFIGRIDPLTDHVYVGTGFNGWGMTTGTAAGMLLADLIVTGSSPWADVFDPQRLTPGASAKRFLAENAKVGGSFVGDRIKSLLASLEARGSGGIPDTGEARVVRRTDQPLGIYRDEEETVHAVSATCPHMGCLVRWNDAEATWDCPCHGSRFTHEGEVLSGPAVEGLLYREL
ncbi:FAD-dependent oxidoreductase [Natrinema altunense]|uniref:FAD dependent oxidoreductase n=1 Tax=Natrinema altunense (strain JCM 12890 / CGMCC 1.3731 / AJ2) TaxID=1227494 RepID=L9ZIU4_NATA2|nr:FAD-dependent oxidoreductase [Natrinema altunense]ELY86425.1 FAD dependent oxidoreductase [Natrinema altunense JCM 12890]